MSPSTELDEAARVGEVRRRENLNPFLIKKPTEQKLGDARELLERYSRLRPDEVLSHVVAVRDEAWSVEPYPCLGQFSFLDLSISKWSFYQIILRRIKGGEKLLDLGCCFGQDLRQLVADGASSENLFGTDINSKFMALGYDLFLDKDSLRSTFISGDFLADDFPLKSIKGKVDMVYAASFMHLFDRPQQKKIIHRICQILKPRSGSMCFGRQIGDRYPGEYEFGAGRSMYRHDLESFHQLWNEVARARGEKWRVDAELIVDDPTFQIKGRPGFEHGGMLAFCVRRL